MIRTILDRRTGPLLGLDSEGTYPVTFNWDRLLRPELIWAFIPITALIIWGIVTIVGQVHRHRERQAMIEQGIHPDYPPDQVPPPDVGRRPKQ